MKIRKIVAIMIAVAVTASSFPSSSGLQSGMIINATAAETGSDEQGFNIEYTYQAETDTYSVSGYSYSGTDPVDLVIPSSYNGKGVISIENGAFMECDYLRSVHIPAGISKIENSVFYHCYNLESATFDDKITDIGALAFEGCISLVDVKLPASLEIIRPYAFIGCKSLAEIDIPDSVKCMSSSSFSGTAIINNQSEPLKYVGDWLVESDSESEETYYLIKDGTVGIAAYAIWANENVECVELPDSVKYVEGANFYLCRNLENIIFGSNIEYLSKEFIFEDCADNLTVSGELNDYTIGVLKELGFEYDEYEEDIILYGDVNADGRLSTFDVLLIRKYISGGWDVTIDEEMADVNCDGKINTIDVLLLRKVLVGGWDVTLGPAA